MQSAGFVLVGGQSQRMGCNKALLPMPGGATLVQQVAARVLRATGTVALIGPPDIYGRLGYECLPDVKPGYGPLSGIHTALSKKRAQYNLIVACDMPALSMDLLENLLARAETTDSLCVAAEDEAGIHPLCAVYHVRALPRLESALDEKRLRLTSLLEEMGAVRFWSGTPVQNCNTPEEWRRFQRSNAR